MNKMKAAVLSVVVVLLLAAVLVYFDARLISRVQQTTQDQQNTHTSDTGTGSIVNQTTGSEADSSLESTALASSQTAIGVMEPEVMIKTEEVIVNGDTPEYELKLKLCENSDKKTFIRLQYYLNGAGTVNDLDEGQMPELAGIFENREKESSNANAFKIGQALLNPVQSQLYLLIQGAPLGAYTQASFYLVELKDMSIKKLFSYPGLYGEMACNKDYRLLAYSFGDPPHLSSLQEDNLVEVFDCISGEYIIKSNRNKSGNIMGSNSSPDYLYDYEFEAWHSVNILKLRQAARPKKDLDSGLTQTEVLYDIERDLLLNTDGSELKTTAANSDTAMPAVTGAAGSANRDPNSTGDKTETGSAINADADADVQGKSADSDQVKVLKSFYSYLAAENDYTKAMQLLDNDFRLRLDILKQFGAAEISKSDIDADSASAYSELLKAAKFDTISKEVTKDGICTVTYYQIIGLSTDSQLRQFMSAQLKKNGDVWKIILIEDGIQ